jgi:glycosyltransferase involved in cell wall biosynthesis
MISVLILTLNEERNLPRCLDSVSWSDDIVVFDSFSSDRTVEIARSRGVRVVQRRFDNEKEHRTASIQCGFRYPWVFNPDADEVPTPELINEMKQAVTNAEQDVTAFRVRFKTMFFGRWLKHSSLYPTWVVRLFRPEAMSFSRSVNLQYHTTGREEYLREHFLHYTFNNGLDAWFEKHNRYSTGEALESLKHLLSGHRPSLAEILSPDRAIRRRALKELSFRLPMRPLARFLYMYFGRGGFLDARPGLDYSLLLAFYEYQITLKIRELERTSQGLSI